MILFVLEGLFYLEKFLVYRFRLVMSLDNLFGEDGSFEVLLIVGVGFLNLSVFIKLFGEFIKLDFRILIL